jgi:hypothetical protein
MSEKLNAEELAEIVQLEQDYAQVKLSIGNIITQISDLDDKQAELESQKFALLENYRELNEKNKLLNTKLQQKYGRGVINVATGEIITQ